MKLGHNNSKATNALLNGIGESIFTKVAHCKSAKRFGTNLEIFMKEIKKSKKQSLKLTEVSSNN